jgi:hypothetical protein
MKHPLLLIAVFVGATLHLFAAEPAVPMLVPYHHYQQTLVAAQEMEKQRYLAFPVMVRLGAEDLLIGYKRGYGHAFDKEADFDLIHYNPVTERLLPQRASLHRDNVDLQNGEFVRFANGDIACYVDAQSPERVKGDAEATRMGLIEFRSTDNGRTFKDLGRTCVADGVEYGYAFDAITEGGTTWMLAMTFANLPGGKPAAPPRAKAGWVAVLRTDDNGKTWHCAKNLNDEFKAPLNESAFCRTKDGFIFVCRPYASQQVVAVTDQDFNVRKQADWVVQYPGTSINPCIRTSLMG